MAKSGSGSGALKKILQQQSALATKLEAQANAMTEAIVAHSVSRVTQIETEQRQLTAQMQILETERSQAAREIAIKLGLERLPTLTGLLPHLPARDRNALYTLRAQIIETQSRLEILNERNRVLLGTALNVVKHTIELITTAALQPSRYGFNLAHTSAPTFYIDTRV